MKNLKKFFGIFAVMVMLFAITGLCAHARAYYDYVDFSNENMGIFGATLKTETGGFGNYKTENAASGKNDYYGLDALNMDMTTGTEIPNSTLLEVDDTLVTRFRVQNSKQNGSITWLDDMSDEELLKILSDDEKRVVFLTPVGTEVGVNTDDGWVTVTFKENAL